MELKEVAERIKQSHSLENINTLLDGIHPSQAYDMIEWMEKDIRICRIIEEAKLQVESGKDKKKFYQTYQDIKQKAVESHKHDETPAKMIDVDRAVTMAYTILLNMISEINKVVIRQGEAINKIEEHVGLDITEFVKEGDINDSSTRPSNVQRIKEDTNEIK